MIPNEHDVKQALTKIERDSAHPTRKLAMELVEAHRQPKPTMLPVDAIMDRYKSQLDNLIGKR
jgi:hypothetical protein